VQVQSSNAINVEVPTAPRGLSAEFTANQTEIDQFETVDFSATNAGFQYFFSIEDVGGFIFKSGKDVSHEFRNIGQFDVALTQADLNQKASGIQVKRDFIKVNQAPFLLNQPFSVGATAAYSLRKLKFSATKAVRVREDSGNTETDIGFSGTLLDETALLNHCGSANGFVTKWYDQSGNGNDASNATASLQPQIVDSGDLITLNGNKVIRGGVLSIPSLQTIDIFDFNFFCKADKSVSDIRVMFELKGNSFDQLLSFREDELFLRDDGSKRGGLQYSSSSFSNNLIYSAFHNPNNNEVSVFNRNKTKVGTQTRKVTYTTNFSEDVHISSDDKNDGGRAAEDISEIIFYANNFDNINHFNIQDNLNNFYN